MGQTNICLKDNPAKTPMARHQNVAQYVSSKKPLSTNTADRHAHARRYHHYDAAGDDRTKSF